MFFLFAVESLLKAPFMYSKCFGRVVWPRKLVSWTEKFSLWIKSIVGFNMTVDTSTCTCWEGMTRNEIKSNQVTTSIWKMMKWKENMWKVMYDLLYIFNDLVAIYHSWLWDFLQIEIYAKFNHCGYFSRFYIQKRDETAPRFFVTHPIVAEAINICQENIFVTVPSKHRNVKAWAAP